jgi:dienelactone hydrolase
VRRADLSFESDGERCAAWMYLPDGPAAPHPCVILAHGFGMVREARLDAYAEHFAGAGIAALVFDYRHFGASGGLPRQLLDISRQLADWRAAIAFVRGSDELDSSRIALWGTSFSGGHVVALAAGDPEIAAVVSQVPYAGLERRTGPPRVGFLARMVSAAIRDELRGRLGRPPRYIPIAAEDGVFAAFNTPGGMAQMKAIVPADSSWENRFTPRLMLRAPRYRPFEDAASVGCPLLVCVCEDDVVTPPAPALAGAGRAPQGEVRSYPIGHFEIYLGEWFDTAVADQTAFLTSNLGVSASLVAHGR